MYKNLIKINTNIDDYYLNPYKFEYKNCQNINYNLDIDSTNLNFVIKTLTSLICKTNFNLTNNTFNNTKNNLSSLNDNNNDKQIPNIFKLVTNNKFDELEECVKNKNININIQDNDGDTPLHIAIFIGNFKAIKILIDAKADIYMTDKWGQTPLHRICFCLDNPYILKITDLFILSDYNIFNYVDNFDNTPLHLILKYIIKNKIKLNSLQIKFIKKLKILTNIELKNKDGFSIEDLLYCL